MQNRGFIRSASEELDALIQKRLKRLKSDKFILSVYFGRNTSKQYDDLAEELSKLFPAPLLRAYFVCHKDHWELSKLTPIAIGDIPDSHISAVNEFANQYFNVKRHRLNNAQRQEYSMAILTNEKDEAPPSNAKALKKFITLGKKIGLAVEMITPKDLSRVPAFDALFIREDTNVYHHTYRFATLAEAEGVAVIDSPESILRCSNKVFLAELLRMNNIATPRTAILSKNSASKMIKDFEFPIVIKLPDSSSSRGVGKANSEEELVLKTKELFKHSDLLIVQEYTPTDYDWRIGILDGEALFACKYFMAKGHWQIYNWSASQKKTKEGDHLTVAIEDVPADVVKIALDATNLIGSGLYGVDIKIFNNKPIVIEVNENPNIDSGVEDQILGDELYLKILLAIRKRIEQRYEQVSQKFTIAI